MSLVNSSETHARIKIDSMILAAGFELKESVSNAASASVEQDIFDPAIKERLKKAGKRPDYHFYVPQSSKPIAFLEAKKPGVDLNSALEQAAEYAKIAYASNNPPMLVFASDGIQVRSRHADGRTLEVNNFPVDYIPDWELMQSLIHQPSVTHGDTVDNVKNLIQIFKNAAASMRQGGVDAGINQLREFCIMLFIKIMDERGNPRARQDWSSLKNMRGEKLRDDYQDILTYYRTKYGGVFKASEINDAAVIENMISEIAHVNFTNSKMDIKGEAFEYFLKNYSAGNKSVLGQYFTPRHITAMMAAFLNPQIGERILDPFCGTGGMLIACYSSIKNGISRSSSASQHTLNEKTLFGCDISNGASSLAKMNMILLGDGHSNIQNIDCFKDHSSINEFDKVITNIPFNIKDPIDTRNMSTWIQAGNLGRTYDRNELSIIKCIESLKPGGEGAIIVPLTLCISERYKTIRDYLAKKCGIKACIRLPEKTFISYTSAQTAIILFDGAHEKETDVFTYIHLKNDGLSQDKNREPVPGSEIPQLLELGSEQRFSDFPGAVQIAYAPGDAFVQFSQIVNPQGETWLLRDLINIKSAESNIISDKWYAEPRLDSENNTVKVSGNHRLGKNIKAAQKVIAEPGDLIIASLHTNSGNGLFAISGDYYICTSQLVAQIKEDLVPASYLVRILRKEFPRQLIPADLVGRETFSKEQILNVVLPKPDDGVLQRLKEIDAKIKESRFNLENLVKEIDGLLSDL